jgi:hypothetical protein
MNLLKKAFHFLKKDTKGEKIEQFEPQDIRGEKIEQFELKDTKGKKIEQFDNNLAQKNIDCLGINDILDNNKNIIKNKNKKNNIIKLVIILFLLYIFISSKFFTSTILKLCGSKFIDNNRPTLLGNILQGIFLVIFYMLFAH